MNINEESLQSVKSKFHIQGHQQTNKIQRFVNRQTLYDGEEISLIKITHAAI